jgi:hypothetical protein
MSVDDNSDEQRLYDIWISILKQCEERQRILSRDKLHLEEEQNNIKELELLTSTSTSIYYRTHLSSALRRIEQEMDEIDELEILLSTFDNNLMKAYNQFSEVHQIVGMVEAMEEFDIYNRDSFDNLLLALLRMENKRLYRLRARRFLRR